MKLSIIIVSWNTKDIISDCLDSILRNTAAFPYEIIGAIGLFCGVIIALLGLRRAFRLLDTIIHKGRSGAR